jgi:BatD DUF11 like domain
MKNGFPVKIKFVRKIFLIILGSLFLFSAAQAKDVRVETSLSSNRVNMGDNVVLNITIVSDDGSTDFLEQFSIPDLENLVAFGVKRDHITRKSGGRSLSEERVQIFLKPDRAGKIEIPNLSFSVTRRNGATEIVKTEALEVYVNKPAGKMSWKSLSEENKGSFTLDPMTIAKWLVIISFLLIAPFIFTRVFIRPKAAAGFTVHQDGKGGPRIIEVEPEIVNSAADSALVKLDALQKRLYAQSVAEVFASLLETVREFIFRQWDIPAAEITTMEIVARLGEKDLPHDQVKAVADFLYFGDLVKFARYIPTVVDTGAQIEKIRELLNQLK